MKGLALFLLFVAALGVLSVGAAAWLVVQLSPYVLLGVVVGLIIQNRRRPRQPQVYRAPPPPQNPLPPGGWVYVPVWVDPPPALPRPGPVINAEFIRDPFDGR